MKTRQASILHHVTSLIVLFSLLVSQVGAFSPSPTFPKIQTKDAQQEIPGILFRTSVSLRQPQDSQRLKEMGVMILNEDSDSALLLVTADQLETLARLQFNPQETNELGALTEAHAAINSDLLVSLQPILEQTSLTKARSALSKTNPVQTEYNAEALLARVTVEQQKALSALASVDDDGDGLTNTQEVWWCTEPSIPDTDGDGVTDGNEVQAAKNWLANAAATYPASGKPFAGWPDSIPGCQDDDMDSVPDLAEVWDLGLNPNRESTDRDKFDDGQELFGNTNCPGSGGFCGYGSLPRNEDWGTIFAEMPSWVEAPGNHPMIGAFPVPEIDLATDLNGNTFFVETVTTITMDQTISTGTQESYSTAKTQGTSTGVASAQTWNSWQEVSATEFQYERPLNSSINSIDSTDSLIKSEEVEILADAFIDFGGCLADTYSGGSFFGFLGCGKTIKDYRWLLREMNFFSPPLVGEGNVQDADFSGPTCSTTPKVSQGSYCGLDGYHFTSNIENLDPQDAQQFTNSTLSQGSGTQIEYNPNTGDYLRKLYYDIQVPSLLTSSSTETTGHSNGGSITTTTEEFEEHTVTNSEAFSTEESWGTATAANSAHAADLWFNYKVSNVGTEYAREICNLAFNIYIGDTDLPATTYFVGNDIGGSGCFQNFMPDEVHTYTTARIPLSLEQMKAIDLGAPVRITIEDYTYGIDELFYQDASNSGVVIAMEDGTDDGDEAIDTYLTPSWGNESVLDVVGRYFPHETDADGDIIAIWTPEYRSDTPAWCQEPQVTGIGAQRTLWCKHTLSLADWWNIYTNGLGDGTQPLQDTLATPGATALFRFNSDTDLDGYSDRSEWRFGTAIDDASDFPQPELLAGLHTIENGSYVTNTLSFLNTGLYDAYGVEAVMIAPNPTISITNNTVGGSGRVPAQEQIVVGSRIFDPVATSWTGTAQPFSSGYYSGSDNRIYTFSANGSGEIGIDPVFLDWSDGIEESGLLEVGSGYASPTALSVGSYGLELGMLSGTVTHGETFTVAARLPADTFQYEVQSEPYTPPVVVVSYNDPQGNHRFVTPATLTHPTDNLITSSGQMLEEIGVELVTSAPITQTGTYTTDVVVNWPVETPLEESHLFLEFVTITGTVAAEIPVTTTIQTGPNVVPITWSTDVFSPAFQAGEDYIVMAFWTDWQGNIIDTAGRPLSSFQADPKAAFATDEADLSWNFGTARQGTLLQRNFELASVGYQSLRTYIGDAPGITLDGPALAPLSPADMAVYTMTINTTYLAEGPFYQEIPIRTSDPANPERTVVIQGEILPFTPDETQGEVIRPLDWVVTIEGPANQGEWITYTHTFGPNPMTLHPVRVFSEDYTSFWGVGKYATDFGEGTASADMFGDGSDGDLTISSIMTFDPHDANAEGTVGTNTLLLSNQSSGFTANAGDKVLIHQTRGNGAGRYQISTALSYDGNVLTLNAPLDFSPIHSSSAANANKAQVIVVPQYQNVTVNAGGQFLAKPWDGFKGGILVFFANNTFVNNGVVSASGKGYSGGITGPWIDHTYSYSGEGEVGTSIKRRGANGTGGGGGEHKSGRSGGGGGGGHASNGVDGYETSEGNDNGFGGLSAGAANFLTINFGGGGGGGGHSDENNSGGSGGAGGGIILINAYNMEVNANISSMGNSGGNSHFSSPNPVDDAGGGGGGAGGSILLTGSLVNTGVNKLFVSGGSGGISTGPGASGGAGSVGRIHIEFCDSLTGSTNLSATTVQLDCYILKQIETSPYDQAFLNLPESVADTRSYAIQYGRLYTYSSPGDQTQNITLPKQLYTAADFDLLITNPDNASLPVTISLDIGNSGTTDWTKSFNTLPATEALTDAVDVLNSYLISRTDVDWGNEIEVPIRINAVQSVQLLLTDLQLVTQFNQVANKPEALTSTSASLEKPLDIPLIVTGIYDPGTWITYTHALGPNSLTLHPVRVFDQNMTTLLGVGSLATDFSQGTISADIFGDGHGGPFTGGDPNSTRIQLAGNAAAGQLTIPVSSVTGFTVEDEILVIQMQGQGAGTYEFGFINSIGAGTISLKDELINSYYQGGASKAQVLLVPHFTSVTGNVSTSGWNGNTGGIIVFRAWDLNNATVNASYMGFKGGYGNGVTQNPCNGNQGQQGESPIGFGGCSYLPNGGGGGASVYRPGADFGSGGGGGYGSTGGSGSGQTPGSGGTIYGLADLSLLFLGSGGGGGNWGTNPYGGGRSSLQGNDISGQGGGAIFVSARSIDGLSAFANGYVGGNSNGSFGGYAGGGGSGGSIKIVGGQINLETIQALGGIGGDGTLGNGGNGGVGRIQIEYCDTLTGSTNPAASTQQIDCHIVEQEEIAPYTQGNFKVPEAIDGSQSYIIQYGRLYNFVTPGKQTEALRINRQMYNSTSLELLISNTAAASGVLNLCLDIGDDTICNYTNTDALTFPQALTVTTLTDALNDYLLSRNDVPWGDAVDVPVRIQVEDQAQVIVTDLQLTPTGAKTRYVRLLAQDYAEIFLGLQFGQASTPAGPLSFYVDIGADGTVDWSHSGNYSFPIAVDSLGDGVNLATAFNNYLSGHTGMVDVPIRIVPSPFIDTELFSLSAIANAQADATLTATDIALTPTIPVESEMAQVTATLHNPGLLDSNGVTAAFFATDMDGTEWFIGSDFVENVPAGATANLGISWNTLGYTGTVPIRVHIDPYDRVIESSNNNNEATASFTVHSRPDLVAADWIFSDLEPTVGETITITVTMQNSGEALASSTTSTLYNGNPSDGGNSIGTKASSSLPGSAQETLLFTWIPTAVGQQRLFLSLDDSNSVNEFDESNNLLWQDIYVGFAGPLQLDSGDGDTDIMYTTAAGYGYVDLGQPDIMTTCDAGSLPEETLRLDPDGEIEYRFDHLLPGHYYHLDLTLYECDGAGRQESVWIDGVQISGPTDLGDGEVHRLSLRLDPAQYVDRSIAVQIAATGINGAVLSEINLHDVDYRYIDAGGNKDAAYSQESGFGWLNGNVSTAWGSLPYQSVRVNQLGNELQYRFDNLDPTKTYNILTTIWQASGAVNIQSIEVDGFSTGTTINSGDFVVHETEVVVPQSAYAFDRSIVVSIIRHNAATGAMVNEIALEEQTLQSTATCSVAVTPYFSQSYGEIHINDQPAPVGTIVQAMNPRGETVGCFTVTSAGLYGFMRIHGEDTTAVPAIPGMRSGELVSYRVNGVPAVASPVFYWQDDRATHNIDLNVMPLAGQFILLEPGWNWISINVDPPAPLLSSVFSSINGTYDRVLGENGINVPALPPQYNSLDEIHPQLGYMIRVTENKSVNLLVEGVTVPVTTTIPLHAGWNWVGYLPDEAMPVAEALQSIDGQYQLVLGQSGTFDPALPAFSTLQTLYPGEAYMIYTNNDATLTYPAPVGSGSSLAATPEVGSKSVANTPYFTEVYGHLAINGQPAPVGTTIEARSESGEIVGQTVTSQVGLFGFMRIFGADMTALPGIPGLKEGQTVALFVNGLPVTMNSPLIWSDDWLSHRVNLSLQIETIYIPFVVGE